ncbi:unnamed protein product [Ilex paraguariensis]|uniref:Uncharacterized protein n=1 Tax=Ilex paraguariensis TaxID=185542 RepID=A0ABC8UKU8_9AQUA
MGRAASHITLECALQTHPNITLIGEEVAAKKQTLKNVTDYIADVICKRAELGYNYGVILIPEGLIDFIPEVQQLIAELNEILAHDTVDEAGLWKKKLTPPSLQLFDLLPPAIQEQLLLERDPHGNVQVAKIETEKMLIQMAETELEQRKQGGKFKPVIKKAMVAAKKQTLKNVTDYIADVICKRAELGYNYGVILIPEGLIDFIPEVQQLIAELNEILAHDTVDEAGLWKKKLTPPSLQLFDLLPPAIQEQLLLERDPHGNVQVAKIETEKMLIQMAETELEQRKQGVVSDGLTVFELFQLMAENLFGFTGKFKPVIKKAMVELDGAPFKKFASMREEWALKNRYFCPGPIQFVGPVSDQLSHTLLLELGAQA